ncbi:FAD-binding oxidoreductase [Aspergillus ibericus CBS 121593]|uniref:FAD/FMN-containing dehydrogenase n=1 Tax=Aspergillus ibericus CBS 121593 TaxID=1448316 RepID=A0A395GKV5_9EURO|nr:FAD/FMN-containing dehydrogenase [Aspergillus ibericus CBS 121593]RAK96014.1 FAD/FMN-containing dehydrogenase [Aspergillus ibericus CBS 121593]
MLPRVSSTAAVVLTLAHHLTALHPDPGNIRSPAAVDNDGLPISLQSCLGATGAEVVYPTDAEYANLTLPDNSNYHPHPQAIVIPKSTQEVAAIVRCVSAEQGRVTLSPRGGGHGYAAYGFSGQVVIDSSQMTDIVLNEPAQEVTVQMGQTIGILALTIGRAGYALPHGTCPGVGIAGHSLGGGWGYTSRQWGWLVDHLVSLELVDVAGRIHTLGPTTNTSDSDPDLWWALRGAGSNNFGIVTSFTYRMERAPTAITNYNIDFATHSDCVQALLTLQDLGSQPDGLPTSLGGELVITGGYTPPNAYCSFTGQYFGDPSSYNTTIQRFLAPLAQQSIQPQSTTSASFTNWVDALTDLMGPLDDPSIPQPYYAQSLLDPGTPNYTPTTASSILTAVQPAGPAAHISFDLNGPSSATNQPPQNDVGPMSFFHRKSLFLAQIYAADFPGFDDPGRKEALDTIWAISDAVRSADPEGKWHAYQNYIDPDLDNWGEMYYGANLERLKGVKERVDPNHVFDFPQGLGRA